MAEHNKVNIKRKTKIVFIIGSYGVGGKERQLTELIKILPQDEFEIHLFAKYISTYYFDSIKSKVNSYTTLGKKNFSGIKSIKPIIKYFKEVEPDIVHSWSAITSIYSAIARFFVKRKYYFIDGAIRDAWFPYNFLSHKYWQRVFINYFTNCSVGNSYAGIKNYLVSDKKGICIHNGYDFNRIESIASSDSIRKKFGLSGSFVVGMVARFEFHKDWICFIDIAKMITNQIDNISFLCVGGGPNLQKIKDYAGESPNIIFTDIQSDIESIISSFDVGILISNMHRHAEGISNTIMEYMAMSKPLVVSDSGGNKEIVHHNKSGFIVSENNKQEFVKHIIYLYNNPKIRDQMGLEGRRILEEEFSINKMCFNYINLYKNAFLP
jgi:glycosyltransferase involved in cell wall biosynthesis